MKACLILSCMLAAVVVAEKYTSQYDGTDIDEILNNSRLIKGYGDCLMERGPCTSEGKELKAHMQDALTTGCEKCTDKQKEGAQKAIDALIKDHLDLWNELCGKYDPNGIYREKYQDEATKRGIVIPK